MIPIRGSFPLRWPEQYPRTRSPRRAAFNRDRTMAQAGAFLFGELRRLGAHSVEVSSNAQFRGDGLPLSGRPQPAERGAAVYFVMSGKSYAMACDRWDRIEDNLYAVGKYIEAMRAQERYGVGTMEHAFRGYQAVLPAASATAQASAWWLVLGVPENASADEIRAAYRRRAQEPGVHPDRGGLGEEFAVVLAARDAGLQAREGVPSCAQ